MLLIHREKHLLRYRSTFRKYTRMMSTLLLTSGRNKYFAWIFYYVLNDDVKGKIITFTQNI